ncbi:MAG: hypothetical protein SPJ89_04620 [Treponema sp.]|nr:hypothetical protein [Spirochaetia bacterium]MDD7460400.1 hypothetical protein [Spirochaetales bacterium]MDY5811243.1 hypothetical protein [Treponema sp.]
MEGLLTSENFKEFIKEIVSDNYLNIQQLEAGLKKHLNLISKQINLGQLSSIYIAPPTPQNPEGIKVFNILFYSPDGFGSEPYEKNYGTGEGGILTLTFNTCGEKEWTDEELKELDVIADIIYILSSKVRVTMKVKEMSDVISQLSQR